MGTYVYGARYALVRFFAVLFFVSAVTTRCSSLCSNYKYNYYINIYYLRIRVCISYFVCVSLSFFSCFISLYFTLFAR